MCNRWHVIWVSWIFVWLLVLYNIHNRTVNISLAMRIFNKLKYIYTYELAMDYIIIVLK